jgi:H+-transporting ATPase
MVGIAMTPIPALVVAGTLAAAVLFALVLDLIKVPVFAHLGIAESAATSDTGDQTKSKATPATPSAAEPTKTSNAEPEAKPQRESESKPEAPTKPQVKAAAAPVVKTEAQPENKPDAAVATSSDATPQLVKRVHQLYEALGREDVRAVQDWDKAHEKVPPEKD